MLLFSPVDASSNQTLIVAYLDRIKKLYPYGVSVSSIVTASDASAPVIQATASALLVVCDEARSEHDTLLEAICSKGLQLAPGEYVVHYLKRADFSEIILADLIKGHSPVVAIVFGAEGKPRAVTASGPARVLFAEGLEKISNDLSVKKVFWKQLQESVVPLLKAR